MLPVRAGKVQQPGGKALQYSLCIQRCDCELRLCGQPGTLLSSHALLLGSSQSQLTASAKGEQTTSDTSTKPGGPRLYPGTDNAALMTYHGAARRIDIGAHSLSCKDYFTFFSINYSNAFRKRKQLQNLQVLFYLQFMANYDLSMYIERRFL